MPKVLVCFRLSNQALYRLQALAKQGQSKTAIVERALELLYAVETARERAVYTAKLLEIQQKKKESVKA